MLGDLNGAFGVPGENDNGRRVIDFCAEKRLSTTRVCKRPKWRGGKEGGEERCVAPIYWM